MGKIRILDLDVSNRIAAGEVIERPASVVKELVDNSLDAGASQIDIQIEEGGKKLICVTDNGEGMDSEDALLCLEPHATSKIRTTEDLFCIQTLGFRGEALPSIASVSIFLLRTRTQGQTEGTEVLVEGGMIKGVKVCGCPTGTTVMVKRLFYNLPARRKFLRSEQTELDHIHQTVLMLAIANPQVGFTLIHNDRECFRVASQQDLKTRLTMLLGKGLMDEMIPVDYQEGYLRIYGFTAKPGLSRSTRRDQYLFVNRRPVSDLGILSAIRDAYHGLLMKGRYPPLVLFFELPYEQVDINVHPAKKEVRFRDTRLVNSIVGTALRNALQKFATAHSTLKNSSVHLLSITTSSDTSLSPSSSLSNRLSPSVSSGQNRTILKSTTQTKLPHPKDVSQSSISSPLISPERRIDPSLSSVLSFSKDPKSKLSSSESVSVSAFQPDLFDQLKILGILGNAYILGETQEGLILIDQHAAHERILYEKFLQISRQKEGISQKLLLPLSIQLTPPEAQLLRIHQEILQQIGFDIEQFGGDTFLIHAIPSLLPQADIQMLLSDLLAELQESHSQKSKVLNEETIILAACKTAVKSHDFIHHQEVHALLEQLRQCELPYTCPHGRPTMVRITFAEIERRFGRRYST